MKCLKYIKSGMLIMLSALVLTTSTICTDSVNAAANAPVKPAPQTQQKVTQPQAVPVSVDALTVVNTPKAYLNKNIILNAKFDKFSTLGLDYKPAYKSSEDYISFLIKRPDTNFDIPLSEMKLFLKRDVAEKFIDLKSNDEIEIKGVVFSDALGDAWIDVKTITITKKAPSDEKDKD